MRSKPKVLVLFLLGFLFLSGIAMAKSGAVFFKFDKKCVNYSDTLANQIKCVVRVNDDQGVKLAFTENGLGSFYNQSKQNADDETVYAENYNWPTILNSNQSDNFSKVMSYSFNNKTGNKELLKLGLLFLDKREVDNTNSVIISIQETGSSLAAKITGNMISKDNLFQLGKYNPIYCKVETKATNVYISCNCTGFNE